MSDEEIKTLFNVVDKLEKRIFLLEKVIGKLQLRLGDVVLYIDRKEENNDNNWNGKRNNQSNKNRK